VKDADFIGELVSDKEWRINELNTLRRVPLVYSTPTFNKYAPIFWKFCIPAIYSHWEGFVIASFKKLVDFINGQNLKYEDTTVKLIIFSNKNRFIDLMAGDGVNPQQKQNFIEDFLNEQNMGLNIDRKNVTVNSNLNFDRLRILLNEFDLSMSNKYSQNKAQINNLVFIRNSIAHGENSINIGQDDVESMLLLLDELLDEMILLLSDYVVKKKYLANVP